MNPRRLAALFIGTIVLFMGLVFTLQGAGVIGGSSLMSGNSEYIYIGGVVAIVGLVIMVLSARHGGLSPDTRGSSPAAG